MPISYNIPRILQCPYHITYLVFFNALDAYDSHYTFTPLIRLTPMHMIHIIRTTYHTSYSPMSFMHMIHIRHTTNHTSYSPMPFMHMIDIIHLHIVFALPPMHIIHSIHTTYYTSYSPMHTIYHT